MEIPKVYRPLSSPTKNAKRDIILETRANSRNKYDKLPGNSEKSAFMRDATDTADVALLSRKSSRP